MTKLGIVLAVALVVMIAAVSACAEESSGDPVAEATTDSDEATTDEESETAEAPEETAGQENARESAEGYLELSGFSKKGLIEQLKFEGYSNAEAAYAVKAVSPNWNEEAVEAAETYLDTSSFSRSALINQLKFEGFTQAQAEYGVRKAYQ